ncbi:MULTISPECIES: cyclin-dependent kinase inhibitor 3 family protein [Deinococcus]|uniref:Cyclin-dependent kinase inhibitor 3 family protein n=1 Tax=Deinococcus rufus TaxID=2136097 RepID=A0ABV7ZDL1_9DEIO|nr:cyclin-dependent kinase inhibitor 3 family protein [Deinococcus sp. AB2017081]WQE93777.1 cyclin-dependent kinase inhibitor 3 family protein [Deinococcus sp. AB2017081]
MSGPIRVDWIATGLWPGRLGLTFAPGKKGLSVYQPGVTHDRDLRADLETLARDGTQVIAPLIEDFEFDLLGMDGYHDEAEARHLTVVPCPIPDGGVPRDPHAFSTYVDDLMTLLLDGQSVVVHCRGGLGRAGLTAACVLVQAGMTPEDAIRLVRHTRSPHAIETRTQEQFVHDFAHHDPADRPDS